MKEVVKVKYVNPPKEGKKQGSIKTEDGRYFGVYPDKLDQFTAGGTYEVEYETREFKGKTYYTVKSAKAVGAPPPSNGSNGHGNTGSTSDQIRWQTCLKVAGEVYRGAGGEASSTDLVTFARQLFAADPIVEAAKEIFNATEAKNDDEAPGDW